MSKSNLVTIKRPKYNSVYLCQDSGGLYLYYDFNSNINGHVLISLGKTPKHIEYLFLCHSEFKEKYVKIGEL